MKKGRKIKMRGDQRGLRINGVFVEPWRMCGRDAVRARKIRNFDCAKCYL